MRQTAHYEPAKMDAKDEDTKMLFAKDFRHIQMTMIVANSFSGTVKFYASNQEWRPDLDSSASSTNEYSTVDVVYLWNANGWDTIAWDTGFVATWSSDGIYKLEINDNASNWVWSIMTARAAWDVTIFFDFYDNQ